MPEMIPTLLDDNSEINQELSVILFKEKCSGLDNLLTKGIELGSGKLVSRIGLGGMAAVFKIWHPELETHFAIKIARPEQQDNHEQFRAEAKIMAKLNHPNIIRAREVGSWNSLPYIEMEFIEGMSLRELLMHMKTLPVSVALTVALSVVKALNYAHKEPLQIAGKTYNGIIHRDLKPENIMISNKGVVVVMDFGLARPIEVSLNNTMTGCFKGTPLYAPPEQLYTEKEKIDQRIDIYAVGVMLYEMLCGDRPFRHFDPVNDTLSSYTDERKTAHPTPLRKFKSGIPPKLSRIVDKCIAADETVRYPSAAALLSDLEAIDSTLQNVPKDREMFLASYVALKKIGSTTILLEERQAPSRKWLLPVIVVFSIILTTVITFLTVSHFLKDKPPEEATSTRQHDATPATLSAPPKVIHKLQDSVVTPRKQDSLKTVTPAQSISDTASAPAKIDTIALLRKKYRTDNLIRLAESALKRSKYSDFRIVVQHIPIGDVHYLLQCEYQLRRGKPGNAQKAADRIGTSSIESECMKGKIQFSYGRFESAISFLRSAPLHKSLLPERRNEFLDESVVYTARAYTRLFETGMTDNTFIAARKAWEKVERRFSNRTSDKRYAEATNALKTLVQKPTAP